jgi:protein arginine N-methyltransferase 2
MAFKDTILTFENNKIITNDDYHNMEVMMDWEAPIMEKSAEYICESKGDILEIGFGMGICSDYIQAQGVNSHTIVEIHPQIIEKLKIWAEDKSNVTIVEGDWLTCGITNKYDGIFLDTFGDESLDSFKSFAIAIGKIGTKLTYWNNYPHVNDKYNFDDITFEEVTVSPDSNIYTEIQETYYMPKVVL